MNTQTNSIQFTRIAADGNGRPRYVCHFLHFITENDRHCTEGWGIKQTSVLYGIAVKRANEIGGKKYHNKSFGGGIVFQSFNIADTERQIHELMERSK